MPTMRKNPFPRFPLAYVRAGVDAGDWAQIETYFDELEARPLKNPAGLERWLRDFSELAAVLSQEDSRRYIDMTCHTDDPAIEERFLSFQRDIVPRQKPRWQALKRRYLEASVRKQLPRRRYSVFDRVVANEIQLYRDENVPLETRETELAQQYQKIIGAMTVAFDGRERTIPQMNLYIEDRDPKIRKDAWQRIAKRYLQDRDPIDRIFDELVAIRARIARNAGFRNFRDYAFRARARFDYGPEQCFAYHAAAERIVVPLVRKLQEKRRRQLRQPTLRPWDLAVDPEGRPPLRPFKTADRLVRGVGEIYRRVSPDLASTFDAMKARKLLDLESRKGKAPGGYQATLDVDRVPFIFMNAAGLHRDVHTLLHEGGHAFHTVLARRDPLIYYRGAPLEFAEVASQGMEMIGLDHMEVFYSKRDADRARHQHFEHVLGLLTWIAQIDAFQHWIYTDEGHSREDRRRAWLDLRRRFAAGVDWDGCEEAHASMWHRQPHLFASPFYYIEYAISLLGALQLWQNARKNRALAIRRYRKALALGGSRPLPELFATAGLKFDFGERTVAPLVEAVMKEIG